MKVAVFSTKPYDKRFLQAASEDAGHQLSFFEAKLNPSTVRLAEGHDAVCVFVNDQLDADVLKNLNDCGVKLIALRCAGFNNVDLDAAKSNGQTVVRVPAYSPHAVAEHTVALILAANRNIHRAFHRVRDGNFSLDGLLGFDLHGRTVGIIGSGKIGFWFAKIMIGFGCKVLAFDIEPNEECKSLGVEFVTLEALYDRCDIISMHCPLNPQTHHLIDADAIGQMKDGVMIVNTSRGAVIDTAAVIAALKSGKIGHLALDVYEEEGDMFFEDLSNRAIPDDMLARLLTFPNVLITGHQAFFTRDALQQIAETTMRNLTEVENDGTCANLVS